MIFLPPASLRDKIKNLTRPNSRSGITILSLLVVANKNHGQYADRREPFLMEASYHPKAVPLKKGHGRRSCRVLMGINVGFLTTSSYVDPTGFPRGGKYFVFPQNKP